MSKEVWSPEDYRSYKPKKKAKYRSLKAEVDGHKFDSLREAEYYKKLSLLEKAREICDLELQVAYELNAGGSFSYKYVADFRYTVRKTGERMVVDVKGYKTKEFKKKSKLMLKVHGIKVITL